MDNVVWLRQTVPVGGLGMAASVVSGCLGVLLTYCVRCLMLLLTPSSIGRPVGTVYLDSEDTRQGTCGEAPVWPISSAPSHTFCVLFTAFDIQTQS